jgi:hypothetical protein
MNLEKTSIVVSIYRSQISGGPYQKSPKTMSRSASIEHGRCCARVFMRVLEWKEKKHSIFMPCGAIEWLRMSLKEFRVGLEDRTGRGEHTVTAWTVEQVQNCP